MKFHFTVQPYQTAAVESVVKVFAGQPYAARTTYLRDVGTGIAQGSLLPAEEGYRQATLTTESDDGFRNEALQLSEVQLLENIRSVQSAQNIRLSDALSKPLGVCFLDVEMETGTGTGKTYVYIKTMFELNRRYGWSKFIVVVPRGSTVTYDLVGRIATGTTLTRHTAAEILQGIHPAVFAMYRQSPEEKIACAKKLFEKLNGGYVVYEHVNDFKTLLNRVMK